MDVFEHLIILMIIRREVINFGIKTNHSELLTDLTVLKKRDYRFSSLESDFAEFSKKKIKDEDMISLMDQEEI